MLTIGKSNRPTPYKIECQSCGWTESGVMPAGPVELGKNPCPQCKSEGKFNIKLGVVHVGVSINEI